MSRLGLFSRFPNHRGHENKRKKMVQNVGNNIKTLMITYRLQKERIYYYNSVEDNNIK